LEQRRWLERRDHCATRDCIVGLYDRRIDLLYNAEPMQLPARVSAVGEIGRLDQERVRGTCVGADLSGCVVQSVREFAVHQGHHLYRAFYGFPDPLKPQGGSDAGGPYAIAVFQEAPDGSLELLRRHVDWERGSSHEEPRVVVNSVGTFLYLPISAMGTGSYNLSEYYVWRNERWSRVDFTTLERDVDAAAPHGVHVAKGVWPDLDKMSVETDLWRESDPNCCPTGGRLRGSVRLNGTAFRAVGIHFERDASARSAQPEAREGAGLPPRRQASPPAQ
jgi:hypothetical protein